MPRPRSLLLVLAALTVAAAALPFAAAATAPRPTLKVIGLEATTVGGGRKHYKPGTTIKSCASDPTYGLGWTFVWAGMKEPGTERISLDGPGTAADSSSHSRLLDASGENGMTVNAEEFGIGTESLPPGTYRLKLQFDGTTTTSPVKVVAAQC